MYDVNGLRRTYILQRVASETVSACYLLSTRLWFLSEIYEWMIFRVREILTHTIEAPEIFRGKSVEIATNVVFCFRCSQALQAALDVFWMP